jgi:MoxR-like ATPase
MKLKNIAILNKPEDYIPSPQLVQAAEVAYSLKRPLLLSGEPGCGKTDFAKYVASQLASEGFRPRPLIFNTKSSSAATDLFYNYDAVSHFRNTNKGIEEFIQLKALGLAFANAIGGSNLQLNQRIIQKAGDDLSKDPIGSVVLIDEIDKAPRDFSNDLLNEIENYRFEIKELDTPVNLTDGQKEKILIILTSNFEKNLPEAFLRRCVYFHIEFPNPDDLQMIVETRLNLPSDKIDALRQRIRDFFILREDTRVQKKPSTSECLDFIRAIDDVNLIDKKLFDEGRKLIPGSELRSYLPTLLKKKEDLQLFS